MHRLFFLIIPFAFIISCSSKAPTQNLGNEANQLFKDKKYGLSAEKYLEAAEVASAKSPSNPVFMAALYARAGVSYRSAGKYEQAIGAYSRALEIQNNLGLFGDMTTTLSHIGKVYADAGAYYESIQYYLQAYDLQARLSVYDQIPPAQQMQFSYYSGNTLNNLAWYNLKPLKHYTLARAYYMAAIAITEPVQGRQNSVNVYRQNLQEIESLLAREGEAIDAIAAGCSTMYSETEGGTCQDYVGVLFKQLVLDEREGLPALQRSCEDFGEFLQECPSGSVIGTCLLNAFTDKEAFLRYYAQGGSIEWTAQDAENDCLNRQGAWWVP